MHDANAQTEPMTSAMWLVLDNLDTGYGYGTHLLEDEKEEALRGCMDRGWVVRDQDTLRITKVGRRALSLVPVKG